MWPKRSATGCPLRRKSDCAGNGGALRPTARQTAASPAAHRASGPPPPRPRQQADAPPSGRWHRAGFRCNSLRIDLGWQDGPPDVPRQVVKPPRRYCRTARHSNADRRAGPGWIGPRRKGKGHARPPSAPTAAAAPYSYQRPFELTADEAGRDVSSGNRRRSGRPHRACRRATVPPHPRSSKDRAAPAPPSRQRRASSTTGGRFASPGQALPSVVSCVTSPAVPWSL